MGGLAPEAVAGAGVDEARRGPQPGPHGHRAGGGEPRRLGARCALHVGCFATCGSAAIRRHKSSKNPKTHMLGCASQQLLIRCGQARSALCGGRVWENDSRHFASHPISVLIPSVFLVVFF